MGLAESVVTDTCASDDFEYTTTEEHFPGDGPTQSDSATFSFTGVPQCGAGEQLFTESDKHSSAKFLLHLSEGCSLSQAAFTEFCFPM